MFAAYKNTLVFFFNSNLLFLDICFLGVVFPAVYQMEER